MSKPASESDLVRAIRAEYPAREYAVLRQVANGTGFAANRHADAIAMGLWPSRGLHLHGFECKSHRGDWKRERDKPEKAESIASRCNYWWIVAATEKVVDVDELPQPWGLMVLADGKLKRVKPAVFRDVSASMPVEFVAAILRQAQTQIDEDAIRESVAKEITATVHAEARKAAEESYRDRSEHKTQYLEAENERARKVIDGFEKASGINLGQFSYFDPAKLGRAFHAALYGDHERSRERLIEAARAVITALDCPVAP